MFVQGSWAGAVCEVVVVGVGAWVRPFVCWPGLGASLGAWVVRVSAYFSVGDSPRVYQTKYP